MFETAAISALALYRVAPTLAGEVLGDRLNAGVAAFGLSFSEVARVGSESAAFSNGAMRVSLVASDGAAEASGFVGPLGASYTSIRPNDYAARVAAHAATVTLTVSDARTDRTIPIPDTTLIVVCHAALVALIAQAVPLVIHWRQSDMLVLPAEVPAIRGIGFPVSLATRPEIAKSRPDPRGRTKLGVMAARSEIFFGMPVRVEPTTHPIPEVLSLIDFCILRRLGGDDLLTDGATLGLPGPVEVAVRHLPVSEQLPLGAISLTVRPMPQRTQPHRPAGVLDAFPPRRPAPYEQPRVTMRDGSETLKAPRSDRG